MTAGRVPAAAALLLLAAAGSTWAVSDPEGSEDVMAALAVTGQGMSAARLQRLAGAWDTPPGGQLWWRSRGSAAGPHYRELRTRGEGAGFGADGRAWRWSDGTAGRAGWVRWQGRHGGVLAGGWSWRCGFGLVAGGAGRRAGLTADAGLGPGGRGLQNWGRAPEARTVTGGALAGRVGPVVATVAVGRMRNLPVRLASLARADRTLGALVVEGPPGDLTVGVHGRWRREAWFGGWEVAVPSARGGPWSPAVAVSAGWRGGRHLTLEALVTAQPGGHASVLAAPVPLVGRAGGRGWAFRGKVGFPTGPRVAVLCSRADRRDAAPGPETRELVEIQMTGHGATEIAWEVAWRLERRTRVAWIEGWSWLPPVREDGLRRSALRFTLTGTAGSVRWRCGVRSRAVDGAATTGRRSLLAAQVRGTGRYGFAWRGGRALAWGDPVDLVSVVVPAPGMVVARHWGRWRSETWLGLDWSHGPWRLAASGHLREAAATGNLFAEWRVEAGIVGGGRSTGGPGGR